MTLHTRIRSSLPVGGSLLLALVLLFTYLPYHGTPALAQAGTSTFDTATEFSATCTGGPMLSNTSITEDAGGEISLKASIPEDYFRYTGAPDNTIWETRIHSSPEAPTFNVDGTALTITTTPTQTTTTGRGSIRSLATQNYGVLEGLVTFSNGDFQQFGFTDLLFTNQFATFSTRDGAGLYAVTYDGAETSQLLVSPIPTTPQRLRIEWTNQGANDQFRYFLNGNTVPAATLTAAAFPLNTMRVRLSNNSLWAGGLPLRADWIRYTPYPTTSGSYTSCPIVPNANEKMVWGPVTWSETIPSGAGLTVEVRTANTLAGLNAASFVAVANGGTPAVSPGAYAQYRATLTRPAGNNLITPRLNLISLAYTPYDLPDQISPASGDFGTQFLAQGDGFTPNTALTVTLDGQVQGSPALSANNFGEFYLYLNSTNAIIGAHSVTISGAGRSPLTLNFTVTSGGSPTTPPPPAGEPTPPTFDMPPPELSIGDASVTEGDSGTVPMEFTVSLSGPSGQPVTVDYATQNGAVNPASSSSDYTAIPTTQLTFPAGTTVQTITVTIKGDTTTEQNETLRVNLTNISNNATLADNQGVGTIINDDGSVLSIDDVSVAEGNAGTTTMTFAVSMSKPNDNDVTVNYVTADGTAGAPDDYTAIPTTQLTFLANTTDPQTITVQVKGDTLFEADETLLVELTGATNATIADSEGVGTITNDDTQPSLSISNASVTEGNAGTSDLVFSVSLSAASGLTTTVDYATANGTASAPGDYTAIPTTSLSFPPGATTQTITVEVKGETLFESNETVLAHLTNASNATIADAEGIGIISNDDAPPAVSIGDASVTEGNAGTASLVFSVSLSAVSGQDVTVDYATADGTASAPGDYTAIPTTPLTILAGATTGTITVQAKGDTLDELDETLLVNLSSPAGATIADGQGTGTIVDDDAPPALSIGNASAIEGNAGSVNMTFTVSLSAASGKQVMVNYFTQNGTASAPGDYTAIPSTPLTFPAGTTTRTVTVQAKGDTAVESSETLLVKLTSPSNATIADAEGVGTIVDDDASPAISIGDASVTEGDAGSVNMTFTVSLSGPSGLPVTVNYATADGTASAPGDYTAIPITQLSFSPGTTVRTITVQVKGDTIHEPNETLRVNLTSASNATIADGQGLGTIQDDDSVSAPQYKIYLPLVQR